MDSDATYLNFTNNVAQYGGAIYATGTSSENYYDLVCKLLKAAYYGNTAIIAGQRAFASCNTVSTCIDASSITLLPKNIAFHKAVAVFPGQVIELNVTVTDCHGNPSSCTADVTMHCNNEFCANHTISLHGPPVLLLSTGVINTGLIITGNSSSSVSPQLHFRCKTPIIDEWVPPVQILNMQLVDCPPLGLYYNTTTRKCSCSHTDNLIKAVFICSPDIGKACVIKGYWYGYVSDTATVSKCLHSFCNYSRDPCPQELTSDVNNYVLLQDDQCLYDHGGTLCTECSQEYRPAYGFPPTIVKIGSNGYYFC